MESHIATGKWHTIPEVAKVYGISEKSVRSRLKLGEWKFKREGFRHGSRILVLIDFEHIQM